MTKKKKKKKRNLWDPKKTQIFIEGIGVSGLRWFEKRCGRTKAALYAKARREYGGGGLTRGAYSVHQIASVTGYAVSAIKRAQKALNQKWKRFGRRGVHLITEEQYVDIVEWLKSDYWSKSKRLYGCVWCADNERKLLGSGLCLRCYHVHRRLCRTEKLPWTVAEQLAWVRGLQEKGLSRIFLEECEARLVGGLALERRAIEKLGKVCHGYATSD